jgi:hypothetical protein
MSLTLRLKQTGTPIPTIQRRDPSLDYVYIGWNELRPVFRDKRAQAPRGWSTGMHHRARVLFGYGEKIDSIYRFARSTTPTKGYAFDPDRASASRRRRMGRPRR